MRWLGARPERIRWESGHLSRVVGLRLDDGRNVVLKIRPASARVRACTAVQADLAANGFPCPRPLTAPAPLGGALATAEEQAADGAQLESAPDSAALFAGLLADLIRLAPGPAERFMLRPSPPWVGWDHPEAAIWPVPDHLGRNLNAAAGPHWLDQAAGRARACLRQLRAPLVIGHADWESQNIRWAGRRPLAVHDWDSVAAQPEAAIAGAASAVWPAAGAPGQAATVEQSEAFLAAYESVRRRPWAADERRACWAAGIWIRSYNAKHDAAKGGGPQLDLLSDEIGIRLRQAGL